MSFWKKKTPADEFNRQASYVAEKCGLEVKAVQRAFKDDSGFLSEVFNEISSKTREKNWSYGAAITFGIIAVATIPIVKVGARLTLPILGAAAAACWLNGSSASKRLETVKAGVVEHVNKEGSRSFSLT